MDDKQGNAPDVIIQGAGALATKYHLMLDIPVILTPLSGDIDPPYNWTGSKSVMD